MGIKGIALKRSIASVLVLPVVTSWKGRHFRAIAKKNHSAFLFRLES
jgi:hypothetical protein